MLANLTDEQLTDLATTKRDRCLELLLKPSGHPAEGLQASGFETVEACLAEDRIRAEGLRNLKSEPWVVNCDPIGLAKVLATSAEPYQSKAMEPWRDAALD